MSKKTSISLTAVRIQFWFLLLLLPFGVVAQRVKSPAYDDKLQELLDHSVREVTVAELAKKTEALLLDARAWKEYQVSHIPGAVWVGYDDFNLSRLADADKSKEIIVYCSVGYRSEKIAGKLQGAGYTQVANLYGGIFEWVNQGHPVVDQQERATQRIHAYDENWGRWVTRGTKVY